MGLAQFVDLRRGWRVVLGIKNRCCVFGGGRLIPQYALWCALNVLLIIYLKLPLLFSCPVENLSSDCCKINDVYKVFFLILSRYLVELLQLPWMFKGDMIPGQHQIFVNSLTDSLNSLNVSHRYQDEKGKRELGAYREVADWMFEVNKI